jgi:hypothetical protein
VSIDRVASPIRDAVDDVWGGSSGCLAGLGEFSRELKSKPELGTRADVGTGR